MRGGEKKRGMTFFNVSKGGGKIGGGKRARGGGPTKGRERGVKRGQRSSPRDDGKE